ncbi:MAG: GNAT family N-acetyltransferase [Alphaproteobacteria bacterium]
MDIREDDLRGPEIIRLLETHLAHMHSITPIESAHALDLDGLRHPSVTFWTVWDGDALAGCGALKELDRSHAEIKSMHTAAAFRGRGVAALLVDHILKTAQERGYSRLSLETGVTEHFAAAQALYRKFGFEKTGPFSTYREDPHSLFMTKELVG